MKARAVLTGLAMGCLALAFACSSDAPSTRTGAWVVVTGQALSGSISSVTVTVTGSGIAAPGISFDLTQQNGQWQGQILDLPAGNDRVFSATAKDGSGTPLYQG